MRNFHWKILDKSKLENGRHYRKTTHFFPFTDETHACTRTHTHTHSFIHVKKVVSRDRKYMTQIYFTTDMCPFSTYYMWSSGRYRGSSCFSSSHSSGLDHFIIDVQVLPKFLWKREKVWRLEKDSQPYRRIPITLWLPPLQQKSSLFITLSPFPFFTLHHNKSSK